MANTISTSTNSVATQLGNNTLVQVASDGTALVIWFDGTNQKFSYASSPYSSWTTTTLTSGSRFAAASAFDSGDNVFAITSATGGPITYYPLTKSGTSYSVGSGTQVSSNTATFNAGNPMMVAKDGQGRYWCIANNNNNTICQAYYSSTPTTANWTSSLSATAFNNPLLPVADIVGNYLVAIYDTAATTFKYQRSDISGASPGSWSTATTITVDSFADNTSGWSFRGNGSGVGILVYNSAGIKAQSYTASTDTWSSVSTLSSTGSDRHATVVRVGSDIYCFWCQFSATNNYALVYKKWTAATSTWDTNPTTLVAAGTNISNPNAGASSGTIGVVYTVGTASPWSVKFETVALTTTTNYSFTDALTSSDIPEMQSGAVEALTSSDIPSMQMGPVDALTSSDIAGTQTGPVDTLTATDTQINTGEATSSDALTASDVPEMQAGAIDALTISDIPGAQTGAVDVLTASDIPGAQAGPVDALTATDTLLNTGSPTTSDVLTVTDGASSEVSVIPMEALSIGDIPEMQSGSVDSLTIGDVPGTQSGPVDTLTFSDVAGAQSGPVDALTVVDTQIATGSPTSADALTASDGVSIEGTAIPTDALSTTEILTITFSTSTVEQNTISDVAIGGGDTYTAVEGLISSDSALTAADLTLTDALTTTDIAGSQQGIVEALSIADGITGEDVGTLRDQNTITESLVTSEETSIIDALNVSDTILSAEAYASIDALSGGDLFTAGDTPTFSDPLAASDGATAQGTYGPIDGLSAGSAINNTDEVSASDALALSDSAVPSGGMVFGDPLVGASSIITSDAYITTEANSVLESLSQEDGAAWVEVDPLSDSFTVSIDGTGNTYLFVDQLAINETFAVEMQANISDPGTVSDISLTGGSLSIGDSLQAADIANWQAILTLIDMLATSQTLSLEGIATLLDALTMTEASGINQWGTDPLVIVDSVISQDTSLPVNVLSASSAANVEETLDASDPLSISDITASSNGSIFADPLVSADSVTTSDTYIPTDAGSILDSLTQTGNATWIEIDPLVDSFSSVEEGPGITYIFVDQLTALETLIAETQASASEVDPIADRLQASAASTATDNLQGVGIANWATLLSLIEALGASQSLTSGNATTGIDSLIATDVTGIGRWNVDQLTSVDAFAPANSANIIDANSVADSVSLTNQAQFADIQALADVSILEKVYVTVGSLLLQESFLTIDTAQWRELLSIGDVLSVPLFVIIPSATATSATGRDGSITATGRDGGVVAQGRDGAVTAGGRG